MAAFQASPPKRNLKSLSGPTSWFWKNVTSLVASPYSQSNASTPPMPEKLPLRMLSRKVENSEKSSTDSPESPPPLGLAGSLVSRVYHHGRITADALSLVISEPKPVPLTRFSPNTNRPGLRVFQVLT